MDPFLFLKEIGGLPRNVYAHTSISLLCVHKFFPPLLQAAHDTHDSLCTWLIPILTYLGQVSPPESTGQAHLFHWLHGALLCGWTRFIFLGNIYFNKFQTHTTIDRNIQKLYSESPYTCFSTFIMASLTSFIPYTESQHTWILMWSEILSFH